MEAKEPADEAATPAPDEIDLPPPGESLRSRIGPTHAPTLSAPRRGVQIHIIWLYYIYY